MMVHMAELYSITTCFFLAFALSQSAPLPTLPTRCEHLCVSCKDEAILAQAACNCTTNQQRLVQDFPCHGKLDPPPNEKSTTRQKRCTAEELYQLREKIEATKRNIERLRHQKSLIGANLHSDYYPRQAHAIPSVIHPLIAPVDPVRHVLPAPLTHLEDVGNPRPWLRGSADLRSPLVHLENAGNPRPWQIGSLDQLRSSRGHVEGAGNPRPWQRMSGDREESPGPWQRRAQHGQEAQDINDSVAPRRHVERAPLSVTETTTTDPIEFLQKRRQLLEENLEILLKNFGKVSAENVNEAFSKLNDESRQLVDPTGDLNKHPRKIDINAAVDNEDNTTKARTKLSKISVTAQFHTRNDIVKSVDYVNKTLSQQKDDLSSARTTSQSNQLTNIEPPLLVEHANETRSHGSDVSKQLHLVESRAETSTTTTSEPAVSGDNNTRKRLDVIVDIAVMPNSRGQTDSRVTGQFDSPEEEEEERRKEAFVSQHAPHTLSPPIVLDSNPGFRMSRNQEDESDEGGGGVSNHKDFVPSVSKVYILKSFQSEKANFGIPKAQDLYLHKKGRSVFSK